MRMFYAKNVRAGEGAYSEGGYLDGEDEKFRENNVIITEERAKGNADSDIVQNEPYGIEKTGLH